MQKKEISPVNPYNLVVSVSLDAGENKDALRVCCNYPKCVATELKTTLAERLALDGGMYDVIALVRVGALPGVLQKGDFLERVAKKDIKALCQALELCRGFFMALVSHSPLIKGVVVGQGYKSSA